MEEKNRIEISARISARVRDVILVLSALGVGGNLAWCYHHEQEIQKLKHMQEQTVSQSKNQGD